MQPEYKRNPNTECKICKKPIYRRPFQIKSGPVYCDRKCAQVLKKKEETKCAACENTFARKLRKKYCSQDCANKNRKRRGPYQKGNLGGSNKSTRLRLRLLEVRLNKCNRCDYNKIQFLQVHHIVERCNGGTDAFDNLELICANCHVEHHHGKPFSD